MYVTIFVISDNNACPQETDPGHDALDNTARVGAIDRMAPGGASQRARLPASSRTRGTSASCRIIGSPSSLSLRISRPGARVVIMEHGVSKAFADRFMVGSAVVAGVVATVIMLGMCGMRVQFI